MAILLYDPSIVRGRLREEYNEADVWDDDDSRFVVAVLENAAALRGHNRLPRWARRLDVTIADVQQMAARLVPTNWNFNNSSYNYSEDYKRSLKSRMWHIFKAIVMLVCQEFCDDCGVPDAWCVHHLHYRHLWHPTFVDVQPLCHPCHIKAHGGRPLRRQEDRANAAEAERTYYAEKSGERDRR